MWPDQLRLGVQQQSDFETTYHDDSDPLQHWLFSNVDSHPIVYFMRVCGCFGLPLVFQQDITTEECHNIIFVLKLLFAVHGASQLAALHSSTASSAWCQSLVFQEHADQAWDCVQNCSLGP